MKAIDNIRSFKFFPREVLSVECRFGTEGLWWSVAHLKRSKDTVELEGTNQGTSLKEVLGGFKELPVILVLGGKKVLSKSGERVGDDEKAFEKAFPNVNPEDVYYQVDESTNDLQRVSVIRREMLEEPLQSLEEVKRMVVDLNIGDGGLVRLMDHISEDVKSILESRVDMDSEVEVDCMGYRLPQGCLRAFLSGINFLGSEEYVSGEDFIHTLREDWKYSFLFKKGLYGGVILFFLALLINFLLFTHYNDLNQDLEFQTQGFDGRINELERLKDEYKEIQSFLQVNGQDHGELAMMGDQIASKVPREVALSRLAFNPVERHLKRENLIRYFQGEILVEGTARRYGAFAEWVDGVKSLDWVSSLEIVGYEESGSKKEGEFSVKIGYKS